MKTATNRRCALLNSKADFFSGTIRGLFLEETTHFLSDKSYGTGRHECPSGCGKHRRNLWKDNLSEAGYFMKLWSTAPATARASKTSKNRSRFLAPALSSSRFFQSHFCHSRSLIGTDSPANPGATDGSFIFQLSGECPGSSVFYCTISIMQEDIGEQLHSHSQIAVVVDQAHLSELIHEMSDPRTRCADHFSKGFVTQQGNPLVRLGVVLS